MCVCVCFYSSDELLLDVERLSIVIAAKDFLGHIIATHEHEELEEAMHAFAEKSREVFEAVLAGAPIQWANDEIHHLKVTFIRWVAMNHPGNIMEIIRAIDWLYSGLESLFEAAALVSLKDVGIDSVGVNPVPSFIEVLEQMKNTFKGKE